MVGRRDFLIKGENRMFMRMLLAFIAVALSGCAHHYQFDSSSVAGIEVPDRLGPGWTYTIDDSIHDARRTNFKPNGQPCSLHSYSLSVSDALEGAIRRGMDEFLEGGTTTKGAGSGPRNIIFRLEQFQPRFQCAIGATEGACTGTAEISLGVTVVNDGARRTFSVTAERSADAPGGSMCSNALAAPAEAARKAAKEVVERAIERIYTSVRLK
jgi:hypothetical protein